MKHISTMTKSQQGNSQSNHTKEKFENKISIVDVAKLFDELDSIFPLTFKNKYSDHSSAWLMKFNYYGLQPENLFHGLKRVLDIGDKFPPSCGEFINLCREYKKPVHASHKSGYSLPAPNISKEDVDGYRKSLKQKITGYSERLQNQQEKETVKKHKQNPDTKDYLLMSYLMFLGRDVSIVRRLTAVRGQV